VGEKKAKARTFLLQMENKLCCSTGKFVYYFKRQDGEQLVKTVMSSLIISKY